MAAEDNEPEAYFSAEEEVNEKNGSASGKEGDVDENNISASGIEGETKNKNSSAENEGAVTNEEEKSEEKITSEQWKVCTEQQFRDSLSL